MLKIRLQKNLRREILRGHPWIYQNALQAPLAGSQSSLAQLEDPKGEAFAWVVTDPQGGISARVLSLAKRAPDEDFYLDRVHLASQRRAHFDHSVTNCYRLINGEGDLLPGLVVDIYGTTAVVQFDGEDLSRYWLSFSLKDWIISACPFIENVLIKSRGGQKLQLLHGTLIPKVEVLENGARFRVDIEQGQKTGFFLDQRDNRLYIRHLAKGLKVLNLFSYTGGFSINAGLGDAQEVTSVDVSEGSLKESQSNWSLNQLSVTHSTLSKDIYAYLPQMKNRYDLIIVDPPSMAPSEKAKPQAIKKYIEVFAEAAKKVEPKGHLVLSSCSSHISFDDFFMIITEALSEARRRGQMFRVSGQGEDHPFLHVSHEMRYLKFVHLALD